MLPSSWIICSDSGLKRINDWFCRVSCWFLEHVDLDGSQFMISNGSLRSLTKYFISNVQRLAFMSKTCLRTVWHINHVTSRPVLSCACSTLKSFLSSDVRVCITLVSWTGFPQMSRNKSSHSLWRTKFFAERINIDLLRTGRFPFMLHTDHVMRDIGSPRSLTNWI